MLNLHGEYLLYWHKASFHMGFVDKLWKHILVEHLPLKFGNVICDSKVFVALRDLDTLHFNISVLDQHQSLFWRFCERLTCTMTMIQLSDPVIFSEIAKSGKYSMIPVWGKSCFDLCGCCAAIFIAQKDAKSFLLYKSRYSTEARFMKLIH